MLKNRPFFFAALWYTALEYRGKGGCRMRSRKEKAAYFLYDCGLLEALRTCGEPHVIGSYRMDMMAWNDLDIDVENEAMSMEKLYALSDFIIKTFRPTWYEAKQEVNEKGETVWFHGFETMITGELWNVDIWFFSREEIKEAERYCDAVSAKATEEERGAIVAIKEELIRRGLYSFERYRSVDVYKAVTGMGVRTVEEFLRRYDMQRDREGS